MSGGFVAPQQTQIPLTPWRRGAASKRAVPGKRARWLSTNDVYDPATNTWESRRPMAVPRNHAFAGAVNGKIYVIGGRIGHGFILSATNTDAWGVRPTNGWLRSCGGEVTTHDRATSATNAWKRHSSPQVVGFSHSPLIQSTAGRWRRSTLVLVRRRPRRLNARPRASMATTRSNITVAEPATPCIRRKA